MNVNPHSGQFGKVVPWDSLTPEQQESGDWVIVIEENLPAKVVAQARRRTFLDDIPKTQLTEVFRVRHDGGEDYR